MGYQSSEVPLEEDDPAEATWTAASNVCAAVGPITDEKFRRERTLAGSALGVAPPPAHGSGRRDLAGFSRCQPDKPAQRERAGDQAETSNVGVQSYPQQIRNCTSKIGSQLLESNFPWALVEPMGLSLKFASEKYPPDFQVQHGVPQAWWQRRDKATESCTVRLPLNEGQTARNVSYVERTVQK